MQAVKCFHFTEEPVEDRLETGWLLAFSNYDKALAVQPESCINMLKLMYLVIPFVLDAIITFILSRMKVEEANDKIRAEMKN